MTNVVKKDVEKEGLTICFRKTTSQIRFNAIFPMVLRGSNKPAESLMRFPVEEPL